MRMDIFCIVRAWVSLDLFRKVVDFVEFYVTYLLGVIRGDLNFAIDSNVYSLLNLFKNEGR